MTEFLIRRFVPDYESVEKTDVRERYGILGGAVGIVCNLILFALKLLAGFLSGAISIIADAFNNLSDAGSSIVTLLGFKLAGRPADLSHPFGHGRIEYLAGLFISVAIIFVGVELFRSSLHKVFAPERIEVDMIAIGILVASILMKFWMALFNRKVGVKIKSSAMEATATDSFNDCIATAVVLLSIGIYYFTGINIDGYAGVAVALFIFYSGVCTAKETLQPLLGQAPEEAFVAEIEKYVENYPNVIGMHDLIVHDYGPGRRFVSLHVEVSAAMDMLEAHEIIDQLEYNLHKILCSEVIIHMDPIMIDDQKINAMRETVEQIVLTVDTQFTMHDFRVTNSHRGFNLIFDVVVPHRYEQSDKELKALITTEVQKLDCKYKAIVHIDHSYV